MQGIPVQHSKYLHTSEQFPKLSVSETDFKYRVQSQFPTLCVYLIDTSGCKMSKCVPVQ
jgi:hypothetical protein